jgi:hypothetical protein
VTISRHDALNLLNIAVLATLSAFWAVMIVLPSPVVSAQVAAIETVRQDIADLTNRMDRSMAEPYRSIFR